MIGAGLGLRQGEVLGLHVWRQVKMVRSKLCFRLPKGRKDVPSPPSVARAIRQHMAQFARLLVQHPGFHALRHFFALDELEAGESVVSLARWLGHSDPGFTLRKYSHFLPRADARGSAAFDAIFA
ncbi:hypothetical protein ABZ299_00500 [Streptomyces sp. NPDC006184]|uniref:hypothetical protein n=1 Tax=Streptomyces sp. NPDC006184 TaxID=3155455 RepID=UPI0033B08C35